MKYILQYNIAEFWNVGESFTFEQGNRRKTTQIIRDSRGYTYAMSRHMSTGQIVWRCSKQYRGKCKAYVHTLGDVIVNRIRDHNH